MRRASHLLGDLDGRGRHVVRVVDEPVDDAVVHDHAVVLGAIVADLSVASAERVAAGKEHKGDHAERPPVHAAVVLIVQQHLGRCGPSAAERGAAHAPMYCTVPQMVIVRPPAGTILARPKSISRMWSALLSSKIFSSFKSRKMTPRSCRNDSAWQRQCGRHTPQCHLAELQHVAGGAVRRELALAAQDLEHVAARHVLQGKAARVVELPDVEQPDDERTARHHVLRR